jgi:hypothetical protein
MSKIDDSNGVCTQITIVKLDPGNQQEVLNLMRQRTRFMAASLASCQSSCTAARRAAPRTARARRGGEQQDHSRPETALPPRSSPHWTGSTIFMQPVDLLSFSSECSRRVVLRTGPLCQSGPDGAANPWRGAPVAYRDDQIPGWSGAPLHADPKGIVAKRPERL